jgi:hypothetical protein
MNALFDRRAADAVNVEDSAKPVRTRMVDDTELHELGRRRRELLVHRTVAEYPPGWLR